MKITDIKVFITCPGPHNLVVVKVLTSEPGLYGLGCATFTQRCKAVACVVEEYLKPLLVGRDPRNTQELWNLCNVNAYWRNGPVLNSALGGVDMALWDIKGKLAGMPVYQLLGGKSRQAMAVYRYASGTCREQVLEQAQALWDQGSRYIRCQIAPEVCEPDFPPEKAEGVPDGVYYNSGSYLRETVSMLEYVRDKMGDKPELLHDAHERLVPVDAIRLAKELEPLHLFFLEDLFAPEQGDYLRMLRAQCATPIALGELFVNPTEWLGLVKERLIDFMRIHISAVGGVTPAIKCAAVCDAFGVRLAWHGPTDMSPIGHVAQMHIDIASQNFGIKEWSGFHPEVHEVFTGIPTLKGTYAYLEDGPGWGVDFDEEAAQKYPHREEIIRWTEFRTPDGTHMWP